MVAQRISTQYDHRKIPILGLVAETASSAPSSPVNGQLYYDTTDNRLYVRENGAFALASRTGAELLANKGQASGYASLDGSTKVPIAQIPTGTSGTTVPFGNDARFTDQRVPTDGSVTGGAAGAGVKIAASTITAANLASSLFDQAAGTSSLRQLGFGGTQALAGTTRLDQITAPTASVSLNNQTLTNVGPPSGANDAATKAYVDGLSQGFAGSKEPARVVVSTNVNLASPGATLDGVTMVVGDRFLARAQTTTTQNGIYVWNGAAVAATRAPDADATGEVKDGTLISIAEGTKANSLYQQQAIASGAPGAWTQTWTEFQSAVAYTQGNGIDITSFVISAKKNTADATNPITIDTNGIGLATVPIDHGGTGQTTAAAAIVALGGMRRYTALLGAMTAGVEVNVAHNLNTLYPADPSFQLAADNSYLDLSVRVIDANTVGVTSDEAYAASAVRVIVIG